MAKNITLMGASYSDVPAVQLPVTGGGNALFYDMDYDFSLFGLNVEDLGQIHTETLSLDDIGYSSWTPTTTATSLREYQQVGTYSADMDSYEYFLRWRYDFTPAYTEGATLKTQIGRTVFSLWQAMHRRPGTMGALASDTNNRNYCITIFSGSAYTIYYKSSGDADILQGSGFGVGVYPSATNSAFSSSTSSTPTIYLRTPSITARCRPTYFSTARASEIDPANSIIKMTGHLFRAKVDSSPWRRMYDDAIYVYNNPL